MVYVIQLGGFLGLATIQAATRVVIVRKNKGKREKRL